MRTLVPTLEDFVRDMGLELEASSPVTARSFVTVPGLQCERIDCYHWPRKRNSGPWDRRVYVMVYHDGSFATMIGMEPEYLKDGAKCAPPRKG